MSENLPVPINDIRHGPAMQALPNDRWRAFVSHLVETGCKPAIAAEAAGFKDGSRGNSLAHDPRIQAALHEECMRRVQAHGPVAFKVLIEIASNPKAKNADRIKAAVELLNRGGFHPVSEHHLTVTHQTEAQKDEEIKVLAAELGLDDAATAKLLGKPVVREIEAEIIPTEPRPVGRPITNPDRTDAERASDAARKRGAGRSMADFAEQQRRRGQQVYHAAQELQEARSLGFDTARQMHAALGSEGIEDILGPLDDILFPTPTEETSHHE